MTADPHAPPFREHFAGLRQIYPPAGPTGTVLEGCFGCGSAHPSGLQVRCFAAADAVIAPVLLAAAYAGYPGVAHGGIVAAVLDEVLAAAITHATGRVMVTGELTVRYVSPVPVEQPLLARGRLVADHGRYVDADGRLEELASGRVLAAARGRFFPIREETPATRREAAPR